MAEPVVGAIITINNLSETELLNATAAEGDIFRGWYAWGENEADIKCYIDGVEKDFGLIKNANPEDQYKPLPPRVLSAGNVVSLKATKRSGNGTGHDYRGVLYFS